mmetsp:Transcript_35982/g.72431  ORF Transcript_35982/g.72431 Transcript_35982/m.72431 type:complete len:105 (+) Transcript_35982:2-316(+)
MALDTVVGSDLTYDTTIMPALAAVLQRILKPRGPASVAVLAMVKRSNYSLEAWLEALNAAALDYQQLEFTDATWSAAGRYAYHADDKPKSIDAATVRVFRITGS